MKMNKREAVGMAAKQAMAQTHSVEDIGRACIEAMIEPADGMVIAGAKAMVGIATSGGGSVIIGQPKDVWQAMCRAALEGE